jgi:hypothetical protein
VDVEHPGRHGGLVGHDSDDIPVEPGERADHVRGPVRVHFKEIAVVDDLADDLAHVVGAGGIGGDEVEFDDTSAAAAMFAVVAALVHAAGKACARSWPTRSTSRSPRWPTTRASWKTSVSTRCCDWK